jgi:anti-sigma-K factor RskA
VLIQNPGREDLVLVITGLASAPAGMEYQVWRIIGQDVAPIGAGTFSILDSNAHLVTILIKFSPSESIGVSVEPAGGSPAPTGDIVLLGTL